MVISATPCDVNDDTIEMTVTNITTPMALDSHLYDSIIFFYISKEFVSLFF